MTITIPIDTSRADIVESHLEGFDYKRSTNEDINGCILFDIEIESLGYNINLLLIRFFHAGIETGKKIFQP